MSGSRIDLETLKGRLRLMRSRLRTIAPSNADGLLRDIEDVRDQVQIAQMRDEARERARARRNGNGSVPSSHAADPIPGEGPPQGGGGAGNGEEAVVAVDGVVEEIA